MLKTMNSKYLLLLKHYTCR